MREAGRGREAFISLSLFAHLPFHPPHRVSTGAMEKIPQPVTVPRMARQHLPKHLRILRLLVLIILYSSMAIMLVALAHGINNVLYLYPRLKSLPINADEIIGQCRQLRMPAGPPSNFHERTSSDRFEAGTPPTLIKNATIWTGRVSGFEVVKGDILVDQGLIQAIGGIEPTYLSSFSHLVTVDAHGAWVTPGYVPLN